VAQSGSPASLRSLRTRWLPNSTAIRGLIEASGLAVGDLSTYYFPGNPRPLGYTFEGRASPVIRP
jgi:hypothetical protein